MSQIPAATFLTNPTFMTQSFPCFVSPCNIRGRIQTFEMGEVTGPGGRKSPVEFRVKPRKGSGGRSAPEA